MTREKHFEMLIDEAIALIAKAERVAWDEIHSYPDCTDPKAEKGWTMQSFASSIQSYIDKTYPEELL